MKASTVFTIFYAVMASALVIPQTANGIEKVAPREAVEDTLQCGVGNPGVGGAGDQNALIDGINHLNQKWPDAVWVVEPDSCNRVSCSWNSAIWLCSDAKSTIKAPTKQITALATMIIDNCIENTFMAIWTHGRAYHNEDWNVILGKDKC
ncbi:hypothetical protein G7Z17_g890 [Cylindrodendrum hubeiense]|uniref:Secreted protein n=1 Tax=Cylindrodendrum hubeiense TaxID=595255 RepID=A0A9P5HJA6_9HYPO|nr:hypothetical protein G7Z17_g890 [Cylindrodendrum hubeiense]